MLPTVHGAHWGDNFISLLRNDRGIPSESENDEEVISWRSLEDAQVYPYYKATFAMRPTASLQRSGEL